MVLSTRTARRPRDEGEWRLVKRQKPSFRMPWLDPTGRSSWLKAAVLLGALLPGVFWVTMEGQPSLNTVLNEI
jgi:hypothetical protein